MGLATLKLANDLLAFPSLGKGFSSPLSEDPATGDLTGVSGEDNVKMCIIDLIGTQVGERVMNEDIGTSIPRLLFNSREGFMDAAPAQLRECILRYEPRVSQVRVTAKEFEDTAVLLQVSYVLRSTGVRDSLVFPVYYEHTERAV